MQIDKYLEWFFQPFFRMKTGQIIGLASRESNLHDGLAVAQLARFFPLFEFEKISLEPSRQGFEPQENVILVGRAELFIKSGPGKLPRPAVIGKKLEERLLRIKDRFCYALTSEKESVVVNQLSNRRYVPSLPENGELETDFGVIRRLFRGPTENTVELEGVHRLGTLGVAKVLTSRMYLQGIFDFMKELERVEGIQIDDARPLEILVKAEFDSKVYDGVFSLGNITARPVAIVYDREWIRGFASKDVWTNQVPWDLSMALTKGQKPRPFVGPDELGKPRMVIEGDLRGADRETSELFRRVFLPEGAPPTAKEKKEVLRSLRSVYDRFRIDLVTDLQEWRLPEGANSAIRENRKVFVLAICLGLFLGQPFSCDEKEVEKILPHDTRTGNTRSWRAYLVSTVVGQLRGGFQALLGSSEKRKDLVRLGRPKRADEYELTLEKLSLGLRLRLDDAKSPDDSRSS